MRLGPCDPKPITRNKRNSKQGGDQPSALEGLPPGPHSGEGAGEITRLPSVRSRGRISSKKVWAANDNKQGKTKTTRKQETKHPAVQRPKRIRGPSGAQGHESQENPKNARGQKQHPDETQTAEREGRTA